MQYVLRFKSYIAHPFWAEKDRVIEIEKRSGWKRQKSEAKQAAVLVAYLDKIGMTRKEYDRLLELSERQWYRKGNADDGVIIIPRHQISACIHEASKLANAAARLAPADQIRSLLQISDFETDKVKGDGVWERYVKMETSHQRSFRSNPYLEDFEATGEIDYDDLKPQAVLDFLKYCGRVVGTGAARNMGYGRFAPVE